MARTNVFSPRADLVLRAGFAALGLAAVGGGIAAFVLGNPNVEPGMSVPVAQPVFFSHEHHVGRLGLDCRYCHADAEDSDFAGMPAAETCMGCHAQLYDTAPMLAPVRDAWRTGVPLAWRRVYELPDHVYFSHKVHVASGVACASCHGQMDRQPLTSQESPLTMGWCLDCHRHPRLSTEASVRSPTPTPAGPAALARIDRPDLLTNCSACHY